MKERLIIIFCILSILTLYTNLQCTTEQPGIIVYKHANFEGASKFIPIGQNFGNLRTVDWNDKISSIKLIRAGQVIIYDHEYFQGEHTTIIDHVTDMALFTQGSQQNWNDRISSMKVVYKDAGRTPQQFGVDYGKPYCIFYADTKRTGLTYEASLGYGQQIKVDWKGKISSVWVKEGYKLIIYEKEGFQGKQLILQAKSEKGTFYDLSVFKFNKLTSSYKLEPIPGYKFKNKVPEKKY